MPRQRGLIPKAEIVKLHKEGKSIRNLALLSGFPANRVREILNKKEGKKVMGIKELIEESYSNAKAHGFWEDFKYNPKCLEYMGQVPQEDKSIINNAIGNRLMLIVSEVAEAQDGLRYNDIANFKEELADVAIRLGDLCGGLDIDLEEEIKKKMAKNKDRPYLHGKAF